MKVLSEHEVYHYSDYGDHVTLFATVVADTAEELPEQFKRQCYCSHDCCGHFNGGVTKVTVADKFGHYNVVAKYYQNV